MMIRKLTEIKNLGLFDNYHWNGEMPGFEHFNLIYGWNGSGKTTLSELFNSFELGGTDLFPQLKYVIETDEGKYEQGNSYVKKVRVFNQHYISQNLDMSSCKASPIFILGEENIKLAELIKNDELILRGNPEIEGDFGKLKERIIKTENLDQKKTNLGKHFSDVAKRISSNISGVTARDYRKNNAENDFRILTKKNLLPESELNQCVNTLKQQEMGILELLDMEQLEENIEKIIVETREVLHQTIEVFLIERLQENSEISRWVEEGYKLHIKLDSQQCEFCNQNLPVDRIKKLAGYFNEADKKLKDEIIYLIQHINKYSSMIQNIEPLDKANLYSEFRNEYVIKINEFNSRKKELVEEISKIVMELENKKFHTTELIDLKTTIDTRPLMNATEEVNTILDKHNIKARDFTNKVKEAQDKLKKHYLSEIFDEIKILNDEISNLEKVINILNNGDPENSENIGIMQLEARIEENKNKISESGIACEEINSQLETFLGRRELTFEVSEDGYILKRNGELARNLSEGEKTAIAFVYFTIHLKDRDFVNGDGIVVVDDPISSLDSNSLFQAFSFLKTSVKNCSQVFIFTHNYDFLKLIINWFDNIPKSKGKTALYMINNQYEDGQRSARIDILDELLRKYKSEYQYLFSLIYNFKSDGKIETVYHMPNIARKVLEYFLDLMVPDNRAQYKKLEQIPFDENKKTAIYKFTNDQSHITGKGFDPSLLSETRNVISYLLEMMRTVFPSHYEILEHTVNIGDES